MTRKRFAPRKLEALLEKFGRKCRMCACAIDGASGLEWDHRIPLGIGGEDTLENLEPLCIRCHRTKTRGDVAQIAKAARQRKADVGIKPLGKPLSDARPRRTGRASEPLKKVLPPRRSLFLER
ncbi:MAG TPA: HNH endonuclease signature motif containing protein [Microvirga sp.]|jgi:5-methylcytosine-specific restriction endonuclease McrA|nr:HNH endonuclease signature motif containing protein [Microvirga sp.]